MSIKDILDEIRSESGSNAKLEILGKYVDNETLKQVLYYTYSRKVKFHIKKIPTYENSESNHFTLDDALVRLGHLRRKLVTGNEAIDFLAETLSGCTKNDAHVIERIIDRDLKIGMNRTNINKVFDNLIEKTPYQGASSFKKQLAEEILEKGPARSQIKMDGRYCNAIIDEGVYLESRSGEDTYLPQSKLMTQLESFPDGYVINGELTMDGIDRNTSNGIVTSLISISSKLRDGEDATKDIENLNKRHGLDYQEALDLIKFTVWDMVTYDEYLERKSKRPYEERANLLRKIISRTHSINVEFVEERIVTTYAEAMEHFQDALSRGLEGTILKSSTAPWKDGKPKWQVKMKLEIDLDMKIVGFNYGTKGSKNEHRISSLNVESSDGKVKTRPTGISEKDMDYITANQEELLGRIVEMKCCGVSHDNDGNYSTLHPVFKSIRDDKFEADSFDTIMEIENMAKALS